VKIGVCAKVTPDTDTRIRINAAGNGIDEAGVKWIVSPYDSFAIEEAVKTKESQGGDVVIFSIGGANALKALRSGGLAVGGDSLTLIDDAGALAADPLATARILAAGAKAEGCELLFCGKQAADDDNGQVPAMIAELLGWEQVSMVTEFSTDGFIFSATRAIGGGIEEKVTGNLPVVITADKGLNTPRYAKLPQIMKAKKKPVNKVSPADLGLSADDMAPAVSLSNWGMPAERAKGRILEGDTQTVVAELIRVLRDEAKVL